MSLSPLALVEELHRRQAEMYAGGPVDRVRELLAEDIVWHVPGDSPIAGDHRGPDAVLDYFSRRRAIAGGTMRMIPKGTLEDGNAVAMLVDGRAHLGGADVEWSTVGVYRIRDGRIAEVWLVPLDAARFDELWSSAAGDVDLRDFIRDIPDFPKPGIVFKDITPLLLSPPAFDRAVKGLAAYAGPLGVDLIVAAEARGFIFGGALARELGVGFVPARKPGKLPYETITAQYGLEYGVDELQLHVDALAGGARVLVHDDVLATGGTSKAKIDLVEQLGGQVVGCAFVVELAFLRGRELLVGHDVNALVCFDDPGGGTP
jgi:adenine phosphoribosyltransferase